MSTCSELSWRLGWRHFCISKRAWPLGKGSQSVYFANPRNAGAKVAFGCTHTSRREAMESLEELFVETVKDIYYAEKKILKALPKMAKKATSPDLAAAFEAHMEETEG